MNRLIHKAEAKVAARYQDSNVLRMKKNHGQEDIEKPDKTFITYDDDSGTFHVYLTSVITGPEDYTNVFDTLIGAKDDEYIRIYLCTQGGRLDTTNIIRGLAAKCRAYTCAIVGDVASAGTILALSFDDLEVLPNIEFMCHNFSGGSSGKGHEIYSHVDFLKSEMPRIFQDYYKNFLTADECNLVISGQDLYLNSEQVTERWPNKCRIEDQEVLDASKQGEAEKLEGILDYLEEQGYKVTKSKTK